MSLILTPGDPEWEWTMDNLPPPPNWRTHDPHGETGLIQDLESGVWVAANQGEFIAAMYEQGDRLFEEE
ncbi:hypothetical protein [Picosynechococcus sp. NKBG15041c]|uniref:hypothetical protein n=1 Tax=Picosynechococcus sp. NKBG15041c TaxID=1407650 RepID=UPI000402614E|nr:hypothetical protein [Picosynechococcus sp. NKBG15041c]